MTTEDPASVFLESERLPGSGDVSSSPTFRHGSSEILLPSSKNPLEDLTNPYYLHHGDNPGNVQSLNFSPAKITMFLGAVLCNYPFLSKIN